MARPTTRLPGATENCRCRIFQCARQFVSCRDGSAIQGLSDARLFAHASGMLRPLSAEEAGMLAELEIELVGSENAWIGIEDEAEMAGAARLILVPNATLTTTLPQALLALPVCDVEPAPDLPDLGKARRAVDHLLARGESTGTNERRFAGSLRGGQTWMSIVCSHCAAEGNSRCSCARGSGRRPGHRATELDLSRFDRMSG